MFPPRDIDDQIILQSDWMEYMLINISKFWVLNCGKNTFVSYFQSGYTLRLTKDTYNRSRQVSVWLDMSGKTQSKTVASDANFPWWVSPRKKSKKLVNSFHIPSAIWLDKSILVYILYRRIFPDTWFPYESRAL